MVTHVGAFFLPLKEGNVCSHVVCSKAHILDPLSIKYKCWMTCDYFISKYQLYWLLFTIVSFMHACSSFGNSLFSVWVTE